MKRMKQCVLRIFSMLLCLSITLSVLTTASFAADSSSYMLMDVDGNGVINISDTSLIIDKLLGNVELDETQLLAADCDVDGSVTIMDVFEIMEYLADPASYVAQGNGESISPYMTRGIDVSKWQGNINWQLVADMGVDFVILRVGYGMYTDQMDSCFKANYNGAKAAGIAVGVYHYSYAQSVSDATREAEVAIEWLSGLQLEFPVFYDIEHYTTLSRSLVGDIITTYCTALEAAGYFVGVYSYSYYLRDNIPAEVLAKYSVWCADVSMAHAYQGDLDMWQYSHSGAVDGISGSVDMNYCYRDYETVIKLLGFNGFERAVG